MNADSAVSHTNRPTRPLPADTHRNQHASSPICLARCRRHWRRSGGFDRLYPDRPARLSRVALRARSLPTFSHRGITDPGNLLGAEAAEYAGKDAVRATSSRSTACSSSAPAGKLSEPFYFWDNKPHECSQTWQVVRSEFDQMMLEQCSRAWGRVHEGVRVMDVLFEGDRAVGVKLQTEDGNPRVGRKSSSMPAVRVALLKNKFNLRVWDPVLNKGAIWTYWEGAYVTPAGTKARRWSCRPQTRRAGSGTSRCTTTSSAWASSRLSITCSKAGTTHETDLS